MASIRISSAPRPSYEDAPDNSGHSGNGCLCDCMCNCKLTRVAAHCITITLAFLFVVAALVVPSWSVGVWSPSADGTRDGIVNSSVHTAVNYGLVQQCNLTVSDADGASSHCGSQWQKTQLSNVQEGDRNVIIQVDGLCSEDYLNANDPNCASNPEGEFCKLKKDSCRLTAAALAFHSFHLTLLVIIALVFCIPPNKRTTTVQRWLGWLAVFCGVMTLILTGASNSIWNSAAADVRSMGASWGMAFCAVGFCVLHVFYADARWKARQARSSLRSAGMATSAAFHSPVPGDAHNPLPSIVAAPAGAGAGAAAI